MDENRIDYLVNHDFPNSILHLLYPITKYNVQYGFYTLILDFIAFEIYIQPEHRGKGLGSGLLPIIIDKCNIFNVNEVSVSHWARNCYLDC